MAAARCFSRKGDFSEGRSVHLRWRSSLKAPLHLGREAAQRILLETLGEHAQEEVVAEGERWRTAVGLGPERTQLVQGEGLEGGDLAADPGRSGLRLGQPGAMVVDGHALQPAWSGASVASPDAP